MVGQTFLSATHRARYLDAPETIRFQNEPPISYYIRTRSLVQMSRLSVINFQLSSNPKSANTLQSHFFQGPSQFLEPHPRYNLSF